jgi:signal transduction histidine kinase
MNESFGVRAKRMLVRLVVLLVVVLLGGAALVLLSQLNARTYSLREEGGALEVMKGRNLPMGSVPYRPGDAALADTYAPIPLEGQDVTELLQRRFSDRDELDRALFALVERLAGQRITSDVPETLERGLYFVRRAERLSGISEDQRRSLKAMQAEVAFYLARTRLDDARQTVAEALVQLRLAAESNGRNARAANQMLSEVEPQAKALEESLRKAVYTLSAPAGEAEKPAPPAPEPPAPGTGPQPAEPMH